VKIVKFGKDRDIKTKFSMIHFKYYNLISIENLFQAWNEFKKGKRGKKDVQNFEINLENYLFDLYLKLKNKNYQHGKYNPFYIYDPKKRHIHKACVADRIVHHLLYKYLYELFDKTFIYDSYSCRLGKGTHRGVKRLSVFIRKVSKNYTGYCWVLKCDIKKFFATVDQEILLNLLKKKIGDINILGLLKEIVESFNSELGKGKGIPLGNLTSQIFANIYLNELDQFIKHKLKIKYYLRYADDFVILSEDKNYLEGLIIKISNFLESNLKLSLHGDKVIIDKYTRGIDFLGYVVLPYAILPRTRTKKRMFRKLKEKVNLSNFDQSLQSYLGYLNHANSYGLAREVKEYYSTRQKLAKK
ncbi:MAG: reverse transcriptase/maturase family protein, partial [Candidatus Woesebacteria bacterium]|nr:reverse transcriptase/maturase family protein [Candidatus Woesebacteria bacterium]